LCCKICRDPWSIRVVIRILEGCFLLLAFFKGLEPYTCDWLSINQNVVERIPQIYSTIRGNSFLPRNIGNKVLTPKYFIHQYLGIMRFTIIQIYEDCPIFPQEFCCNLKPIAHERQPCRVVESVVVPESVVSGVVGGIDVD